MRLAIIVPVLNEAAALPALLTHLLALERGGCQIVVVDGGSEDGSAELAELAGFTLVRAPRGRARQMNAGAALSSAEVLLFLHADTLLPDDGPDLVAQALAGDAHCWGRFNVRIEGRHFMLPVVACLMNLRSRWSGIATGDQALFVSRVIFEAEGGFADQPLMEDVELSARLRKRGAPACISRCATTSGRRWESRGVWRTIGLMWRLRWAYWRGTPAQQLAKAYR